MHNFKKGMTIVEMMISIIIFTLIMGGFTLLFSKAWKSQSFIIESGETSRIAANAIDAMSNDLRKVRLPCAGTNNLYYPIQSGDDFDLVIYLDVDGDGIVERVHYFLENEQLKKGITKPDASCVFDADDSEISVVANYVMNTASQPIFRYYNKDYPGDTTNNPLSTSSLAIDQVKLIRIHLWVNIKPLTAPDNINFETIVNLRNLNENI